MFWEHCELIKCKSFCSQTSSCPSFPDMIYIYWHESEVWVSRRSWWMRGSSQQALLHHNPAQTHIFLFLTVDSSSRRQSASLRTTVSSPAGSSVRLCSETLTRSHAHRDKEAQVCVTDNFLWMLRCYLLTLNTEHTLRGTWLWGPDFWGQSVQWMQRSFFTPNHKCQRLRGKARSPPSHLRYVWAWMSTQSVCQWTRASRSVWETWSWPPLMHYYYPAQRYDRLKNSHVSRHGL